MAGEPVSKVSHASVYQITLSLPAVLDPLTTSTNQEVFEK